MRPRKRILVIQPNPSLRGPIGFVLDVRGYAATVAASLHDASRLLLQAGPRFDALLLVDDRLPWRNVRKLMRLARRKMVPSLAWVEEHTAEEEIEADAVLPLRLARMTDVLSRLCLLVSRKRGPTPRPEGYGAMLVRKRLHKGSRLDDEPDLYRVGKKAAGAMQDGAAWKQFPEVSHG